MTTSDAAQRRRPSRGDAYRFFSLIGLVLAGIVGGLLYRYTRLHPLLIYFAALSAAALSLTGYDKQVAGGTVSRVPEKVLFAAALLGGTFGLLVGMHLFRHKTRKLSFQLVLGAIMVVQAALGYYVVFVLN